jgi:hypothetical protein
MSKSQLAVIGIFLAVLVTLLVNTFLVDVKPKVTVVLPPPQIVKQVIVKRIVVQQPAAKPQIGLVHKLKSVFIGGH